MTKTEKWIYEIGQEIRQILVQERQLRRRYKKCRRAAVRHKKTALATADIMDARGMRQEIKQLRRQRHKLERQRNREQRRTAIFGDSDTIRAPSPVEMMNTWPSLIVFAAISSALLDVIIFTLCGGNFLEIVFSSIMFHGLAFIIGLLAALCWPVWRTTKSLKIPSYRNERTIFSEGLAHGIACIFEAEGAVSHICTAYLAMIGCIVLSKALSLRYSDFYMIGLYQELVFATSGAVLIVIRTFYDMWHH